MIRAKWVGVLNKDLGNERVVSFKKKIIAEKLSISSILPPPAVHENKTSEQQWTTESLCSLLHPKLSIIIPLLKKVDG